MGGNGGQAAECLMASNSGEGTKNAADAVNLLTGDHSSGEKSRLLPEKSSLRGGGKLRGSLPTTGQTAPKGKAARVPTQLPVHRRVRVHRKKVRCGKKKKNNVVFAENVKPQGGADRQAQKQKGNGRRGRTFFGSGGPALGRRFRCQSRVRPGW